MALIASHQKCCVWGWNDKKELKLKTEKLRETSLETLDYAS